MAPSSRRLAPAALALRTAHVGIAVVELASLGSVWHAALTGRRGRYLDAAACLLVAEGAALVVGRGNCPLGPLQQRVGDPTPLFELVLPPRAARLAVPLLSGVAISGLLIAVRRAGSPFRGSPRERARRRGLVGHDRGD
jgi:hypothetical protein